MSLTQALATSVSGLRTTQAGLALIASNIANAETPGYVRKTLTQTTTAAGGVGVSVRAAAINRELDQFLQRQLRVESSGGAYADLRAQFYFLQGHYRSGVGIGANHVLLRTRVGIYRYGRIHGVLALLRIFFTATGTGQQGGG